MDVKTQQTTSTEQSCLFVPEYILYIIKNIFWIAAVSHLLFFLTGLHVFIVRNFHF